MKYPLLRVVRIVLPIVALVLLSGCVVYPAGYNSSYMPTYIDGRYVGEQPAYSTGPTYVTPAPVYVSPAPVYVGPPVYFGFGLNYRSGGHRYKSRGGHRHR